MTEGFSATVRAEESLSPHFEGCKNIVIKEFKAPNPDNPYTLEDYQNEVSVLEVLDGHRNRLPFSIPRLVDHGIYPDREESQPVAFIKMTELQNSLCKVNMDEVSPAQWVEYSRKLGEAAAALHQIPLTDSDRSKLTRNPFEYILNRIKRYDSNAQQKEIIQTALSLANELEGPSVFIHGDLGPRNMFGESLTSDMTGLCDFCFSGLGPKELDFCSLPGGDVHKKLFIEEYMKAGGEAPNQKNIAILEAIFAALEKLEAADRFEQAMKVANIHLEAKTPENFDVPPQDEGIAFKVK